MLRRSALEATSGRLKRWHPKIMTQMPYFLSSRKDFSAATQSKKTTPQGHAPSEKPPTSGNGMSKFLFGGALVGGGLLAAAYQTGYIDQILNKEKKSSIEDKTLSGKYQLDVQEASPSNGEPSSPMAEGVSGNHVATPDSVNLTDLGNRVGSEDLVQGTAEVSPSEDVIAVIEESLSNLADDPANLSEISSEESHGKEKFEPYPIHGGSNVEQNKAAGNTLLAGEIRRDEASYDPKLSANVPKDTKRDEVGEPPSLSDAYLFVEGNKENIDNAINGEATKDPATVPGEKEGSVVAKENTRGTYVSADGKLILDFIEAIHAAEKMQADLDAQKYAEEKRIMKEKYEKELKDARARQLMYAEEAALLDEELNKERAKAASTIKSLQENAEEKLMMELQRKEEEAELQLKKTEELAKAELTAAIAKEKSSQMEKMAEANLHIDALCMAFFARSEEARQSHSVHKLALGALALEDALSKGLPIQAEINALFSSFEGLSRDSFLDLVFSSLPKETLESGIDTILQLNQKFDALKGSLRHYSLIPEGGGGMLTHALAQVASTIKVKETDLSGDGIESVINRVENFLAEGKLAEAADALETGVQGSQAQEIIRDWVTCTRNRAILEQALTLIRSYATSISLT